MGIFDKEEFDPAKRHLQLDIVDGVGVVCTNCEKVLEPRKLPLNTYELVFGQYRYIRQNLPCQPLESSTMQSVSNPIGEEK